MDICKRKYVWLGLCSFLVSFTFFSSLLFPIWGGKSGYEILVDMINDGIDTVGDETIFVSEPYLYETFTPPVNSFGMNSTVIKTLNVSFFKSLLRNNFDISLEYNLHNGQNVWVKNNDFLDVGFDWQNDSDYWKINFTFNKPVTQYALDARFTVVMNLNVLNYVEADTDNPFCYFLNYTVPDSVNPDTGEPEVYNCYFNWSDMMNIPGLIFNHGVQDGKFWFRFRKNDITSNAGSWTYDPTFGYESASGSTVIIYKASTSTEYLLGVYGSPSGTGVVDSISINFQQNLKDVDYECALYEYTDYSSSYAGELLGTTEQIDVPIGASGTGWFTFNFSEPKPEITKDTNYYICCRVVGSYSLGSDNTVVRDSGADDRSIFTSSVSGVSFDDPLTGEGEVSGQIAMYASFTISGVPIISNPNPIDNAYNLSLTNTVVNTTISEVDGNSSTVDFYTSTDNVTFTHRQTNTSVLNESVSYDMSSVLTEYQTIYYWKVTANDTEGNNESKVYSFETTPYRTNFFNDTFPNENFVQSIFGGVEVADGFCNFTLPTSGGTPVGSDVDSSAYCSATSTSDSRWYMSNVQLGDIDYSSSWGTYQDFTFHWTNVSIGDTVDVNTTFTTSSYNWGRSIWVDWDNNQILNTWEKTNLGALDSIDTHSNTITVPDNATKGVTVLARIAVDYNTYPANGCSNYGAGEVEDYGIYIMESPISADYIISKNITKPSGTTWDKFYSDVNDTNNCSFALIDSFDNNFNITSGLVGNGDDISSVSNNTIRIYGNFSDASVSMGSWNITWTSGGVPGEAWNNIQTWNGSIFNNSNWFNMVSWNGSIINSSVNWINQISWNGSIFNNSVWSNIQDFNGSIYNNSNWFDQIDWNGSIWNSSDDWVNIQDWNGSIINSSVNWINQISWNGSIYNISGDGWKNIVYWNGSIFNSTYWVNMVSWNGSLFNGTPLVWNVVEVWDGCRIYNGTGDVHGIDFIDSDGFNYLPMLGLVLIPLVFIFKRKKRKNDNDWRNDRYD